MIRLDDTTGGAVANAISAERHRMGSPATGMVLTLLILTDEESQADATQAAAFASQEHPMRILVMIPRPRTHLQTRLDAEITVGGDEGPGEIAILRLRGELAHHAGSVAIPLLLSDTPIVAYWPGHAPDSLAGDSIGHHAQRRITDASRSPRQLAAIRKRADGYQPGDTDLTWTRITGWRSLLAAALDQPFDKILGAEVSLPKSHASGHLLASWLGDKLNVPTSVVNSKGPGITKVRLLTEGGDITIQRPDGATARLNRPGFPPATIALPQRTRGDQLSEELRRLDPDDIYGQALAGLDKVRSGRLKLDLGKKSGTKGKSTQKENTAEKENRSEQERSSARTVSEDRASAKTVSETTEPADKT